MPSPYVKQLAKKTGKSTSEIESLWDKAKDITSDTFGKPESEFGDREYSYTTGVVKNMLGLGENSMNRPAEFLKSEQPASEYIETMVSSQFDIGHVFVSDRGEPVKRSIAQDADEPMDDVGTKYPKPAPKEPNENYEDDEFGLTGPKTSDMYVEAKCPDCGNNYPEKTGYCVSCKKKVKKEQQLNHDDDKTDVEKWLGLGGEVPYVEKSAKEYIDEKIGGESFPDNLHADEGEPLEDREPNDAGNYKVDTAVVVDITRDDERTVQPWTEEKDDSRDD